MEVFVGPGVVTCGECGYSPIFERLERGATAARARCIRRECSNYNRLFKFPLQFVECEFIDEKETNDRAPD